MTNNREQCILPSKRFTFALSFLDDRPVAIVPPTPFMKLFSSAFQALYAARAFRQALMSLKIPDLRLGEGSSASMENYWQGNSPSGVIYLSEELWQNSRVTATEEEREAIDGE